MSDADDAKQASAVAVFAWLWKNKDWIAARLGELKGWYLRGKGTKKNPGILILGPGGAGKSTLARLLAGEYDYLRDLPGEYEESVGIEVYALKDSPGVEVVVPPGQRQRREATWADLHTDLAAGKFRGVILLCAYGHHSFMLGYKGHKLYRGDKEQFVKEFCAERRAEELEVLRQLIPHVQTSRGKLWMLTLVTKQDLWWRDRTKAEEHYRDGEYSAEVQKVLSQKGLQQFRHEYVFASLVISNFLDWNGQMLTPNAKGYDQKLQVESLRRLFETLGALRQWEAGQ
jgi:hypothetical protein